MKRTIALTVLCVFGFGATVASSAELGKPLTDDQKEMMKNNAMKNMDKVMHYMKMDDRANYMRKRQADSTARGKALFNSTALSTNGRSCATCHPGGGTTGGEVDTPMPSEATGKPYSLPVPTLVGAAATFPKYKVPNDTVITLPEMDNNCTMMFLGAQPLPLGSQESRDLAAYVYSLSNEEKVHVGKMGMMKM